MEVRTPPSTEFVLGIGWLLHDSVMVLPEYPVEDSKSEAEATVTQVGGPVPRALSVLAKLGIRTSLVATVGRDEAGNDCMSSLASRGVGTEEVIVQRNTSTGRSHVWVSRQNASRTISYSRGSDSSIRTTSSLIRLAERATVLHADGRELSTAVELATVALATGAFVVVDAGSWKEGLETLLQHTSFLVASKSTLSQALGTPADRAAQRLLGEFPVRAVVATDGNQGNLIVHRTGSIHIPAYPITAVDTNGAGDMFCGGLIFGHLMGVSLPEAVDYAARVAALACTHLGDYFPARNEIESFASRDGR